MIARATPAPQAAPPPGSVHLIKLCVGVATVAELEAWIAERDALATAAGATFVQRHVTRSTPTRRDEMSHPEPALAIELANNCLGHLHHAGCV